MRGLLYSSCPQSDGGQLGQDGGGGGGGDDDDDDDDETAE